MLIAARSSKDFACCSRPTAMARSKYASAFTASGSGARKQLEERIHTINGMLTHKINQPLAAIVANAHAALRWLSNETPNFDEARAALEAIVSAGHRAGEIARSLNFDLQEGKPSRSMMSFKMSFGFISVEVRTGHRYAASSHRFLHELCHRHSPKQQQRLRAKMQ